MGNDSVVAIVSADQKPLVATEPSPPSTTAIAPSHERSPRTVLWYAMLCAQPAHGVYCEPTSPDIGSTIGPFAFGRLQTTPMSRPSLKPPERPSGLAKASSMVSPRDRSRGRDR